jgi:hypothetical protein
MSSLVSPQGHTSESEIRFLDPTVDVRELDDTFWSVLREFEYQAERERFRVPVGQRTDFASVPRSLVWFIPRYGRYTKAAILHDHLCDLAEQGKFERREADGIFRQAMRSLGVAFIRRWIMWAAVRLGALTTVAGRKGWSVDAPKVIPITIVVGLIVLPAVVTIVVTLAFWHVADTVLYWVLRAVADRQERQQQPAKRVNPPSRFSW